MTASQLRTLKKQFEELLEFDGTKTARDKLVERISSLYECLGRAATSDESQSIYELGELSTHIFKSAIKEVVENDAKWAKKKEGAAKFKTKMFELSIYHMKNCCQNHLDSNNVLWIPYCLSILDKSWIRCEASMEAEISTCLLLCAGATDLCWAEHKHVQQLWEFIWSRIADAHLDMSILKHYVELAVKIMENVELSVFEKSPYSLVERVVKTLKTASDAADSNFWTHSRKYSFVYILSHIVRKFGIEGRDVILRDVFSITTHLHSLISVEEPGMGCESKACMMRLVDDLAKLAVLDRLAEHRVSSERVEEQLRELLRFGVGESLRMAHGFYFSKARFSIPESYVRYLSHWMLVLRELEPEPGKASIYSFDGLATLSFGEHITPCAHKCNAWNGALEILTELIASRKLSTSEVARIVANLWLKRKAFATDALRSTFCSLLAVVVSQTEHDEFGANQVPSIDFILKYSLSLMPTSLAHSAHLVESILRFRARELPREMLRAICDTVSRTVPSSIAVLRLISTFISTTEFDESARFCAINEGDGGAWSLRKDIVNWLLAEPTASSHKLIHQLCQYHPSFCYDDEHESEWIPVSDEDGLLEGIERCHLICAPSTSKMEHFQPIDVAIQAIVQFVHNELQFLLENELSLPVFILCYEFAKKHPEVHFDFQNLYPKICKLSEEMEESEYLQSIHQFTRWPDQLRLPPKCSEKCHVAYLIATLDNQMVHLEPRIFLKKSVIDEVVRRVRSSPSTRSRFQQAMPFNNLVKNFIVENVGDLYQTVHRFVDYSFLLSYRNLVATRAKILEIANDELENDGVVYDVDVAIFTSTTRSACIRNVTPPNRIAGFNLDPYVAAFYPQNVVFNDRNVITMLKELRKSPFLAQNIVRHVMENEGMWHLHTKVTKFLMRDERLLSVCIATIPMMVRYLRVYQVHFGVKWKTVQFLRLNSESMLRCQNYLRKPRANAASLTIDDLITLLAVDQNLWRRAIFTFWRLFQSHPSQVCEALHRFARESTQLNLVLRVATLLKALATSEFRRRVLADPHLLTVFRVVYRSIFSMLAAKSCSTELVELCQDGHLKFDLFEHRLKKIPSRHTDDFMRFQTDIAFSVEKFLRNGVESDDVNYLDFELVEFYRQLNENLSDDTAKCTFIVDFLAAIWHLLPSLSPQLLPIVARFKHVSPAWQRFPQPPHTAPGESTFVWRLRFHVAARLMHHTEFKAGEIATCVMVMLTSMDARFYQRDLIEASQMKRLKEGTRRNVMCVLSRVLRQETRNSTADLFFETVTRAAALFPDIAVCVVPFLFKLCVDVKLEYDFAVGKLLECLKGIDKNSQQEVHCLAESVDALGLNVLARYERLPSSDQIHPQFSIDSFFALARLFVSHGYLTHAFAVANIIFDRLSRPKRNLMMIDRISLESIDRSTEIIDLLVDIYVAEHNSVALASLPPRVQTRSDVRKVMRRKEKEWLRLLSEEQSPRECTILKWLCGLREEDSEGNEKFLNAVLRCQFSEYPKQIDSPSKLVYFLLFHRELNTDVSTVIGDALRAVGAPSTDDFRLISLAADEALFESRSIEEHVVRAVRTLRATAEHRKRGDSHERINERTLEMMRVAQLLCEHRAHGAATLLLSKWKEECAHWEQSDVALVEIGECDVMCQAGDTRMAEIQLRAMQPSGMSDMAIAEWTLVLSRITLEHRNDLDEGIRLLEKGCKRLQKRESVEARMKVLLKFHSVCMDQLSKLEEYRESRTFRMKTEAISVFESQINSASKTLRGNDGKAVQRVRKEQQCEKDDVDKVQRSVLTAAQKAVSSAFDALECIGQLSDDREAIRTASLIVFPLIDVIYKYEQCMEVAALLREHIRHKISTKLWISATSHIASKTFSLEPSPIQRYLYQLLCLLIFDYPYHVLHTVLMYEYGKNGAKARGFLTSVFEMEKERDMKKLREILANMREAHAAYRELTQLDTRGNIRLQTVQINGKPMLRLPADLRIFKCKLRSLPIPTISQKIGRPGDYSPEQLITWKSWKDVFSIADGLSAPKVWEIQGSDGRWYKTVWKKDDVRQDVLVEQMFDVTNNMFDRGMLRTYNVVPLDTECGIIEFCGGTVSIKEMLCGASRDSGLHQEFNPKEISANRVSLMMKEVQADSAEKRRQVFVDICNKYSPVFRHFFYTNFPTAHIWREKIIEYRRSLATWSIVCYIVGLGDRHASNILFDQKLCTFVHIDLGMILEYSKRSLPVPEQVPFRISRDLLDPLLIEGIENGQLADDCTATMKTLKENGKVLLGVASALLRETMTNFKETEQASGRPSYISEMAIGRLRDKLAGTDEGVTAQSSALQVRRLLRDATSADNLSRMFCGWMPFL